MNKIISIISATILGITIMLLPILVFTPTQNGPPEASLTYLNERAKAAQTLGKSDIGAVAFPSSFIQAGLVVIIGLIIALSISLYIKKRASSSII